MVPVSVRSPGERGTYNNRVSAMFAELPVGHRRPGRAAQLDPRADGRAEGVEAGGRGRDPDVADRIRATDAAVARRRACSCAFRSAASTPSRRMSRGRSSRSTRPGRRMLEAFPYVPLAGTRPDRDRDLLVRRHAQLRRHRRLRLRHRHRRARRGHRVRPGGAAADRGARQSRLQKARNAPASPGSRSAQPTSEASR